MFKFTFEYPGHNFHIVMGMRTESHFGPHHVIITHQKQSMMGVLRIIVVCEAEAMMGIEPTDLCVKPLMTPANIDVGSKGLL
jgi:hypothetical protein